MGKTLLTTLLIGGGLLLTILLTSTDDGADNSQLSYEQHPPIATNFWVQKLEEPTDGGNIILRIKYISDNELPAEITLYQMGEISTVIRDDGEYPDITSGDNIYASLMNVDINAFTTALKDKYDQIQAIGYDVQYTGHNAEVTTAAEIDAFDAVAFENYENVPVPMFLIDPVDCGTSILKQNSLFITDLGVVENDLRTYRGEYWKPNPSAPTGYDYNQEDGTVLGSWTFGELIKNIANESITNKSAKELLKEWLQTWTYQHTINGVQVEPREDVYYHLIGPWIVKASETQTTGVVELNASNFNSYVGQSIANWDIAWDAIDEEKLLQYAPFKLTAIVNRLDLRGQPTYNATNNNSGETRFIFTLVDPYKGTIPQAINQDFSGGQPAKMDWEGMNVIFEYSNMRNSECALKNWAQAWLELSALPLGSEAYCHALESLTTDITHVNYLGRPNASALNQIRTNEKLFDRVPGNNCCWGETDWEMRQFEINPTTHKLELVPVTNTPLKSSNYAINSINNNNWNTVTNGLINWLYGIGGPSHLNATINGNHNIPANLCAPTALVNDELIHYYGILEDYLPTSVYDPNNYPGSNTAQQAIHDKQFKDARHQVSLNACQGCHAGEGKSNFMLVAPKGYGEGINYWDAMPTGRVGWVDGRFYQSTASYGNLGLTVNSPPSPATVLNYDITPYTAVQPNVSTPTAFVQDVAPILTGRRYSTPANGTPHWEDDNLDPNENLSSNFGQRDQDLSGTFTINDPSNQQQNGGNSFPRIDEEKHSFNFLQERLNDMCTFLNTACTGVANTGNAPTVGATPPFVALLSTIKKTPAPYGSH